MPAVPIAVGVAQVMRIAVEGSCVWVGPAAAAMSATIHRAQVIPVMPAKRIATGAARAMRNAVQETFVWVGPATATVHVAVRVVLAVVQGLDANGFRLGPDGL
jgi:hypothetical protein